MGQAYRILAPNGEVPASTLVSLYDPRHHPSVIHGVSSPEDVFEEFASCWASKKNADVSLEDFQEYYADVSAGIDNDAQFEALIRNVWHVSGGKGNAANTSCRSVLVLHTDGSTTVEKMKDDIVVDVNNEASVLDNLVAQGIRDIQQIQLLDDSDASGPGLLQQAVLDARRDHETGQRRGQWAPFRNSCQSTPGILGEPGNPIQHLYPIQLAKPKERMMQTTDPVEFSVYSRKDPWETTTQANFPAPATRAPSTVSCGDVLSSNPMAHEIFYEPNKHRLLRSLAGAPNKPVTSGYAVNNLGARESSGNVSANPRKLQAQQISRARVSKRLDCEGDIRMSVYKSDFRDQMRVPIFPQMNVELHKTTTGFGH